jgi:hypothetical protein
VPASQATCTSLLEECFEIVQEIKAQEESKHVGSALKPIYDRLTEIRAELESLVMTHRWSLRETDLWNYSLSLQEIDKMRIDGKFVDAEGNKPRGQYVSICDICDISADAELLCRSSCTCSVGVTVSSIGSYRQVSPSRRSSCQSYATDSYFSGKSVSTLSQANKLSTVKKCLNEVLKYGGPWNPRELYPVRSDNRKIFILSDIWFF